MKFRSGLLAATFLLTPIALQAQTLGYPVSGLYIGAAGGFTIKANPSVKNLSSSLSTGTGISTPNMNHHGHWGGSGRHDWLRAGQRAAYRT